ncbi:flagellar biosynthesis protein FlgD [Pseudolabrys taiwanensis]|uniref:Basal-body rod modification protein FlgD n=1 Tax=Pseudolabrys taiwanensis TaxID=331696 RepID=A0A345ZW33_9HYPH|nr:flagellar hook capping FlgD N-terminal domain-containing protein [Pseudolabrys taiwanensis]AXK81130.1 flagellar biosynthesis protein FlgD [Pseudolabrys taiwanensis]
MAITSTPITSNASSNNSSSNSPTATNAATLGENFSTFLTLLTTQLKNQNPLDPLDTNQFTQQLVQFSQVEQQMKTNDQLGSIIALEKSASSTAALAYVGSTVVVDGSTASLKNGSATWSFNVSKPATATVTIRDATGQTAYSGSFSVTPGQQDFKWDGRSSNGTQWPDGNYSITVTAVDTNGQTVGVSTEVQSLVDSADLSTDPPTLSINGSDYTFDKIKRIVRPSSSGSA